MKLKRTLALLLALVLCLCLCSCAGTQTSAETPNTDMSEPAEPTDASAANMPNFGETEEVEKLEEEVVESEEVEEVEFEDEDIAAAPSEEERASWNPRSVRRLRADKTKESFRSAIRQGNTIYLAFEERLAKMPVGGNADDVEVLLDRDFTGSNEILEIQVVGEWIYIRTDEEVGSYYNVHSLWRIRTDGTGLERLSNILAMDDEEFDTFAVIGDQLYLSCMASERRSASETCFTSTLYCYQLDTGAVTELYRTSSTEADTNLVIFTYNEKSLILLDYTQNKTDPMLLIYEYGAGAPVAAPEALQELMLKMRTGLRDTRRVLYDDMTGTGSYLAEYDETLYRISPENGYLPEELPIQLFTAEEATDFESNRRIEELLVLDKETFVYSYWGVGLGSGLRLYQNGTLTDINGDYGVCLDYPGDGYLYYTCISNYYYHHYRVRLDGTGWEQLDWEHRSYPTAGSYD